MNLLTFAWDMKGMKTMIETMNKILDDVEEMDAHLTEEEVRFTVDDDSKAEWCLRKIREANDEAERMQEWYTEQMRRILKRRDARVSFFEGKLESYFAIVPKRETKTQKTYSLPGGKMILKKQSPEFERDDKLVLAWLNANEEKKFIKIKEAVDWAELKKTLEICGNEAVFTETGEIIPGISVTERPEKFVVEVK